MKTGAVVVSAVFGLLAAGLTHARADTASPAKHSSCETPVHLTEEAEKHMGGALYEGPMKGAESMPGMTGAMPEMKDTTSEMKDAMPGTEGAHEVHTGQHGGVFFMAPNKTHHVEAMYSKECGLRLLLYNAFTESIGVGRFQAFFKVIPEDEDEWDKEVIRFLSPTPEGGVLQASGEHDITGQFKIELYVKFPESDDAEMFNIPVGH
jgi:hypothetical protein